MIGGGHPLKCKFALSTPLLGVVAVLSQNLTNTRVCIAIIAMEFQITNSVH